jgi:hypothetical protein
VDRYSVSGMFFAHFVHFIQRAQKLISISLLLAGQCCKVLSESSMGNQNIG